MKYLITGGTGTVGQALARRLLAEGHLVTIFSRNEDAQIRMRNEFKSDYLTFIVGDVRDYQECYDACGGVDVVYHLAAMKHVGTCEQQPQECVKTNVLGTMNMINAAKTRGVLRFVHLSTDKAVNPINVYGASKLMAEKLVSNASWGSVRWYIVRSGNILGSSNSIVPILIKQAEQGEIKITDGNMTRFFITLTDLIDFMLEDYSGVAIPNMLSFHLRNLAECIRDKYNPDATITETGASQYEKVHEILDSNIPSVTSDKYVIDIKLWI